MYEFPDVVEADIALFFGLYFEKRNLPPTKKDYIQSHVTEFSEGSFLWARLFLYGLGEAQTAADLDSRMHSFPSSILKVYDEALVENAVRHDYNKWQLTQRWRILALLLKSRQLLTVEEVAGASDAVFQGASEWIHNLCKPLVRF